MIPTPTQLIAWSDVDFVDEEQVERLMERAISFIYAYTGAAWKIDGTFAGDPLLESLAKSALQQLVETMSFQGADRAETMADFDIIQSFSAGGYSETRRDPRQSQQIGIAQLIVLQNALWPLMDDEHRDEWIRLVGGPNAPGFAVTEVDWGAGSSYSGHENYTLGELPRDPWPPIN